MLVLGPMFLQGGVVEVVAGKGLVFICPRCEYIDSVVASIERNVIVADIGPPIDRGKF